jgi:beta-galactosidase beta subunit
LQSGDFMLLWPEDGHMPGIAVESPVYVKKAVVKISLD